MVFGVVWLFKRLLWFLRNNSVYRHKGVVALPAPCSELVLGEARVELAPGYEWLVLIRHRRALLPKLPLPIGYPRLLTAGLGTTSLISLIPIRLHVLRIAVNLSSKRLVSASSLILVSSATFTPDLLNTVIIVICCGSTSPAPRRLPTLCFYILAVCLGATFFISCIYSCFYTVDHPLWFQRVFLLAIGLSTSSVLSEALIALLLR